MLSYKDLDDYQHAAKDHILDNSHAGLFMLMGLGKTVTTLTAVNTLKYEELEINKVLVIAPKRVAIDVWPDEVKEWAHLKHLTVSVVTGTERQRHESLKAEADIYTIARDNVAWLVGIYNGKLPFDMLIVDESSSFKNHNSQRFKALKRAQPYFKRVIILTGTPAPNSLIDIWPQLWLLDRGDRLGKTISAYRNEYFRPGAGKGHVVYNYVLRKGAEKQIYSKIGDLVLSMKTEDFVKLPGRREIEVPIKFDSKLQAQYDEFEREAVLELYEKDSEITAVNAAVLANKLLQFANGAIYDENKISHDVHKLKLEALKDIVEDANGRSVLIAWTYQQDRDRIHEALKAYKPRQLKTSKDKQDWNDGKIQVMTMHPASGGHGLNLQKGGNIIVWFGLTWSSELWDQFNARLDRRGQKELVLIHILTSHQTIDQDVMKRIKMKQKGQDALLNAVKARIKKYV